MELSSLLLPADWTREQWEAEARRVYFEDLVPNPPQTPELPWLERRSLLITNTAGAFQKVFGKTEGWASYRHHRTGELDVERMRRVCWIRPVLEMRAPKTQVYVNYHSMKPREYGPRAEREKKRFFVTKGKGILYFVSLKYLENGLVLTTAFPPDGEWLRKTIRQSTLLGPA